MFKKWLNISNDETEYSADEGDNESDFDEEEGKKIKRSLTFIWILDCLGFYMGLVFFFFWKKDWEGELGDKETRGNRNQAESSGIFYLKKLFFLNLI